MRRLAPLLLLVCAGCSEFPCVDAVRTQTVQPVPFEYSRLARYSYWFRDGAQRIVFDREEVPQPARHAVLVHIPGETDPEIHGPMGWSADISGEPTQATLTPMANVRLRAYAAWAGNWAADWIVVNAGVTVVRQALRETAPAAHEAPRPAEGGDVREWFRELARREGLSLDEVELQRAVRTVGSQRPLPQDFGLSLDVHPNWLFVSSDCDPCAAAETWLSETGITHHVLDVSDPSNAGALRTISKSAGLQPAVPTLWAAPVVAQGFAGDYAQVFR